MSRFLSRSSPTSGNSSRDSDRSANRDAVEPQVLHGTAGLVADHMHDAAHLAIALRLLSANIMSANIMASTRDSPLRSGVAVAPRQVTTAYDCSSRTYLRPVVLRGRAGLARPA